MFDDPNLVSAAGLVPMLRHGRMGRLFDRTYAPSTLRSFLHEFRFGHVRQLDVVASRTLVNLAAAPLLQVRDDERVMVDLDDTIIEAHGRRQNGSKGVWWRGGSPT